MRYVEVAPNAQSACYVECFWTLDVEDAAPRHQVLPDGCVDILFSRLQSGTSALSVVGLMTTANYFSLKPGDSFVGVRFRPAMASTFIADAGALTNQTEPLESFWGLHARILLERLAESSAADERLALINHQLRPLEPATALDTAFKELSSSRLPVYRLASEHGISPRHFRRLCEARSGVAPKMLSRILRFRTAVDTIQRLSKDDVQPNWADLAVRCGYYDQAHLIHDFQQFTGVTPGRFLQSQVRKPPLE